MSAFRSIPPCTMCAPKISLSFIYTLKQFFFSLILLFWLKKLQKVDFHKSTLIKIKQQHWRWRKNICVVAKNKCLELCSTAFHLKPNTETIVQSFVLCFVSSNIKIMTNVCSHLFAKFPPKMNEYAYRKWTIASYSEVLPKRPLLIKKFSKNKLPSWSMCMCGINRCQLVTSDRFVVSQDLESRDINLSSNYH